MKRLGFKCFWAISLNVRVSLGTWHKAGQRVIEWKFDLDELNKDGCIYVSVGLGLEDEYAINIDMEYIIVYSLLQKIYRIDDCCCELLHNKTTSILGRQLTGWIVEASQKNLHSALRINQDGCYNFDHDLTTKHKKWADKQRYSMILRNMRKTRKR